MPHQRTRGLLTTAVVCLLSACGWEGAAQEEPVRVERPIYYGSPDTNPAVVAITNGPGYGYFCSGTLISPNVVLTASHCLEGTNPSSIQIFFGNEVGGGGTYVQTTAAQMHPNYNSSSITNDIALIRLAGSAPANVTPIPALPASLALTAADEGSSLEISGFGQTETGSSGDKLHIFVSLSKVCNGPSSCGFGSGVAVPHSIGYPRTSGGTCYGDSGGPAFVVRGGQRYVAGVTSYGDPGCAQYGVSAKVDSYATFINDFIGGVVPEDCDAPGDEDADGLADCADPDCALHPDCLGPDACEQAAPIGCGAQIHGTTVGATAQFLSYGCLSQSTEQGPELAYEITAPPGTQVTASLTITGPGDLDLFLVPPDGPSGVSCSPQGCLDGSFNSGTNAESLSFAVPAGGAFLVVDTWETASSFTLGLTCSGGTVPSQEHCENGIDDDGDGQTDCDDADCASHQACQPDPDPTPEDCQNGLDDDLDGQIDCADPDCAAHPSCAGPTAESCINQVDDDRNGLTDCEDPHCANHPACQPGTSPRGEICDNGLDDDNDGAVDCYDADCIEQPACEGQPAASPAGFGPVLGGCNQSGASPIAPIWILLLWLLLVLRRRR